MEQIEEQDIFALTIYPDKSEDIHVSHALGLVQEARSRISDFDEVWVVFDKNGYTKHKAAFDLAGEPINGKQVNIAFSSIAFEQWVLLHFVKLATSFSKSAHIVEELRTKGYFPDYEKKAYIDTYSFLKDKTLQAIENSAWLKHQLEKSGLLPANPIYELNPYTDVEVLVTRLLSIHWKWTWASVGKSVRVGGIELLIRTHADTVTLQVDITNSTESVLLYNGANIGQHFCVHRALHELTVTIDRTTQILPGGQGTFMLTTSEAYKGYILECRFNHDKVMLDL
jgi:hypothetical protein